jgi:hypothetical protein
MPTLLPPSNWVENGVSGKMLILPPAHPTLRRRTMSTERTKHPLRYVARTGSHAARSALQNHDPSAKGVRIGPAPRRLIIRRPVK